MFKKLILFIIYQLALVNSFDIKKLTASFLLSTSLNNNMPTDNNFFTKENNPILDNNIVQTENPYIF
jgi:hypothetical protein